MNIEGMIGGAIGPKEGERYEAAKEKREELDRAYAEGRADQFAEDKARIDELLAALRGLVDRDLSYFSGFVLDGCIPIKAVQAARDAILKATKEQS